MTRIDIINRVAKIINAMSYLEIGVQFGRCIDNIEVIHRVGVDIRDVREGIKSEEFHLMSSDQFFEENDDSFDLIFIDGFHSYEQAKKDLVNADNCLNEGGVIIMHDTNPYNNERTDVWINGEVYKVICELDEHSVFWTVNADEGVTVISTLAGFTGKNVNFKRFSENKKKYLHLIEEADFIKLFMQ